MRACAMKTYCQLIVTLGLVANTCTGPMKVARSSTTEYYYGFDPIFGRLTPSQDIKDFVASVFRQGSSEEVKPVPQDKGTTLDSGEKLRPAGINDHANVGFELYWPGGEWVVRKAEIDRCNTSDDACSPIFKGYGPVCAGSHDLGAHHTFDNMCELEDTNCRDGSASFMLQSSNENDIRWFPVKRNKGIHLKISTRTPIHFILTRGKDIKMKPQMVIEYGYWYGRCVGFWSSYAGKTGRNYIDWVSYHKNPDYDINNGEELLDTYRVRDFYLKWNEMEGSFTWGSMYSGDRLGRFETVVSPSYSFPVRYLGVFGGNLSSAAWVELTGYLMAYRGECREDLPPLPTEVPKNISGRHKIQLYNFAERMDEFGYNMTRVPDPTVYDYGGDYFQYPGQP